MRKSERYKEDGIKQTKQKLYHSQTFTEKIFMEFLGEECQRKGVDRSLCPPEANRPPAHSSLQRREEGRKVEEIHSRHSGLWAKEGWEQGWRAQRNPSQARWTSAIQGRAERNLSKKKNKHPRARWEHRAETSAEASLGLPDRRAILWRLGLGQQAERDHTRQKARARQRADGTPRLPNTLKTATVLHHLYVLPAPTGQALENNLN